MTQDHYGALEVDPSATHAQVQEAYRRVMRRHHPDVAGADPSAAHKAVLANAAWAVLRDPVARATYDRSRATLNAPALPLVAPPSAYSALRAEKRDAFSKASLRWGVLLLVLCAVVLALVAFR